MALEDEFGVKIPDEEAENIHTVGQAVDLVHQALIVSSDRRRVVVTGWGRSPHRNRRRPVLGQPRGRAVGRRSRHPLRRLPAPDPHRRRGLGLRPDRVLRHEELRRLDRYTQLFLVAVQRLSPRRGSFEEDDPAAARAGVIAGAGFGGCSRSSMRSTRCQRGRTG